MELNIDLKTPYNNLRSTEVAVKFDGNYRHFNSSMGMSVISTVGEIKLASKLRASRFNYIIGEIKFNSPFEDFEVLSMDIFS